MFGHVGRVGGGGDERCFFAHSFSGSHIERSEPFGKKRERYGRGGVIPMKGPKQNET